MQRNIKRRHSSAPCSLQEKSLSLLPPVPSPSLFLSISFFSVSLSLTQLRVLGGNPASHPEAHPLPHSLGLPSQPGRLHATEASWPSPPAPAESQRHVMPGRCPPACFPPTAPGPKVGQTPQLQWTGQGALLGAGSKWCLLHGHQAVTAPRLRAGSRALEPRCPHQWCGVHVREQIATALVIRE